MRVVVFLICIFLCLSCQNHIPNQPKLLPLEERLIDSIKGSSKWEKVDRFVLNVDSLGCSIWGRNEVVTWDLPYEYSLELTTKKLDYFTSIDSVDIHPIYESLLTVLPIKKLRSISIIISYEYKDKLGIGQGKSKSYDWSISR